MSTHGTGAPQPYAPYPSPGSHLAAPPPYWAGPPVPVRRRRSRWLTMGLPVGGVLLLGGCATAFGLLITSVADDLAPAMQAADAYASAVVDERWDDARDLLCGQDQAAVTPADLAAHYAGPDRTGYSIEGVNVNSYNGQKSAQAEVVFTTADGLTARETLPMIPDGDAWRPCP